jgi:hypothetical protein
MSDMRNLDFIIRSLRTILARGHGTVPVPHTDLRILLNEIDRLRRIVGERELPKLPIPIEAIRPKKTL